jgi:glycosyltransferase involved in cell wall biosynthesis
MFYGKYVVKALARQAEILTTVSHATAKDVEKYFGIPASGIHVIWNGIDHDFFKPQQPDEVRTAMDRLGRRKPYFIYLARLEHPGKNHIHLIEEFEKFCTQNPGQPHELLLGGADWHGAEAIHQRIANSPNKDRIRALGFVEKGDLPFWYAGAAAMIYPSLFEGFGLPPAEAMACGCPVISSTCGSLGEVVGDAARIIDPVESGSIAAAMEDVVSSPAKNSEWVRRGLARAAEFSWEKVARAVCHLYNEAAVK